MNDATFLLDESLTKLTEIRNIQNEMDNTAEWERKTQVISNTTNYHLIILYINVNNIIKWPATTSRT